MDLKKLIRNKAVWLFGTVAAVLLWTIIPRFFNQYDEAVESKEIDRENAIVYFDDYCYTAKATVKDTVTNGLVMVDYDIMKLPPSPENHYELHAYIGNGAGIIIANSQTNIHPADIWGPTQYAKDWNDRSRVHFPGSGFKVAKHLANGNYTVVIVMVFYYEGERYQCQMEPIPFVIKRNYQ